jgi:hypothetical protein
VVIICLESRRNALDTVTMNELTNVSRAQRLGWRCSRGGAHCGVDLRVLELDKNAESRKPIGRYAPSAEQLGAAQKMALKGFETQRLAALELLDGFHLLSNDCQLATTRVPRPPTR